MEDLVSEIMTELATDVHQKEEERFNESCLRHLESVISQVTMEECKNVVEGVIRNER
jgi:hypothetical protein